MLTEAEALHTALLEAVLPISMYWGDRFEASEATGQRVQVVNEILRATWGGIPGEPLGPGGVTRIEDAAALGWLAAHIAAQVARHRAPRVRG